MCHVPNAIPPIESHCLVRHLHRPQSKPLDPSTQLLYDVQLPPQGQPFALVVQRKDSSSGRLLGAVFNSSATSLVFKDQYLELSTQLPRTASLYGLGEGLACLRGVCVCV